MCIVWLYNIKVKNTIKRQSERFSLNKIKPTILLYRIQILGMWKADLAGVENSNATKYRILSVTLFVTCCPNQVEELARCSSRQMIEKTHLLSDVVFLFFYFFCMWWCLDIQCKINKKTKTKLWQPSCTNVALHFGHKLLACVNQHVEFCLEPAPVFSSFYSPCQYTHAVTPAHTHKHTHTQPQQVRDCRSRSQCCPICILNACSQPTTVFTVQRSTTNLHT